MLLSKCAFIRFPQFLRKELALIFQEIKLLVSTTVLTILLQFSSTIFQSSFGVLGYKECLVTRKFKFDVTLNEAWMTVIKEKGINTSKIN